MTSRKCCRLQGWSYSIRCHVIGKLQLILGKLKEGVADMAKSVGAGMGQAGWDSVATGRFSFAQLLNPHMLYVLPSLCFPQHLNTGLY